MGLFDRFVPDPPLVCPVCNTVLDDWQSKDGPCMLLTWHQGIKKPVASDWPDDSIPIEYDAFLETWVLPCRFQIYTDVCSCKRTIEAYGICEQDVWLHSEIITHLNLCPDSSISMKDELRIKKDLQEWMEAGPSAPHD